MPYMPPDPVHFMSKYGVYDPEDPGTWWDRPVVPRSRRQQREDQARVRRNMRQYRTTIGGHDIEVSAQYLDSAHVTLWRWHVDGQRVDDFRQAERGDTRHQRPDFTRVWEFPDAPQRPSAAA